MKTKKGFSLIEIILALAILTILVVSSLSVYNKVRSDYVAKQVINDINFLISSVRSVYGGKSFKVKTYDYAILPNSIKNDTKNYFGYNYTDTYATKDGSLSLLAVPGADNYSRSFNVIYQNHDSSSMNKVCSQIISNYHNLLKYDESIIVTHMGGSSSYISGSKKVSGADISTACANNPYIISIVLSY